MKIKTLKYRRWQNFCIFIGSCILLYLLCMVLDFSLHNRAFITGGMLFGFCIFLMLFNIRKKLSYFPLMTASAWLQFHIYVGLFATLLFLVHIDFSIPTGLHESILAILFVIVAGSGFVGIFLTRYLPPKMTASGESLIYENIPTYRVRIQNEVEALVLKSEKESKSSALGDYYISFAADFFQSLPPFLYAIHTTYQKHEDAVFYLSEMINHMKSDEDKRYVIEMKELIETKQNLDFQESAQQLLKGWLFIHIPFTYSMIIFSVLHAVTVIIYMNQI
jgi:hypothetical protein